MNISITTDDIPRLLVFLLLAAVLGYIANLLAGGRAALGWFGTILCGVLGAWLATDVVRPRVPLSLPDEPVLDGVALYTAAIGAFVFSLLWSILTARPSRR
jgi:uncharacterized membrane protein YeaQ/YmgE (transglycosylase-associated protein family)